MKKLVLIVMAVIVLFVASPVYANEFVEQFERKQALKDKQVEKAAAMIISKRFNRNFSETIAVDGFIKPTQGTLTSGFGWRNIGAGQEFHKGIDLANIMGTRVNASQSGIVTYASPMGTYGNVVMIQHTIENKVYATVYAHLSHIGVIAGQTVKQGQTVGDMGSTGRSTGSHLHFEIHEGTWNGSRTNAVDPLKYIGL